MKKKVVMWMANLKESPDFSMIDETQLYDFITKNRLEGRFLKKFREDKLPNRLNTDFIKRIENRYQRILILSRMQINFFGRLQNKASFASKPMLVKSVSCAALCNDKNYIRFSGDIDILSEDIPILKKELQDEGFKEIKGDVTPYEDSVYSKGNIIIEAHKYYPILSKPNLSANTMKTKKQLNIEDISMSKLTYNDLLQNSIIINNDIVSNLLITDPEMTALLSALHMHRNYFWEPYKTPLICIAEAFEIMDLINLPQFDINKFKMLCNKLEAGFSVNYAFQILSAMFECDFPKLNQEDDIGDKAIVKIMNDSFSPYLVTNSNFYKKMAYFSFDDIVESIKYDECKFGEIYYTADMEEPYYASTDLVTLDFEFQITESDKTLNFEFKVNGDVEAGANFFVKIENEFSHIWFDNYPDSIRVYGNGLYDLQTYSGFYKVNISLSKEENNTTIIAVGRDGGDDKNVTVVPLKLTR